MTTLTVPTIMIIIWGTLSRGGFGRALALGGATGAGAAVAIGTTAVPTFYASAVGAAAGLVSEIIRPRKASEPQRRLPPGAALLIAFWVYSVVVTFIAPLLFNGQPVLPSVGSTSVLRAGIITSSNIAQIGYLLLGVCVVIYLARSPKAGPQLIGLISGVTIVLSAWRYLGQIYGAPFPEGFFDNSPSFAYVQTAPGGGLRFRGILSEPAGLAVSALVAMSYMLPRALRVRGIRRVGCIIVAAAACFLGVVSTSTTFIIGGTLILALVFVVLGVGFLVRRVAIGASAVVIGCFAVLGAVALLPRIYAFVEAAIDAKVNSSSYDVRSNVDSGSYDIFLDTWGLGVGLGSSRASSFLPSLLSTTGFVGTLLFAVVVATLVARASKIDPYRPVVWALLSLLLVKIVSGPDLSDTTGVLYVSLGLLSRAVASVDPLEASPLRQSQRLQGFARSRSQAGRLSRSRGRRPGRSDAGQSEQGMQVAVRPARS